MENEIKNNKPAVLTVKGPNGNDTRDKSDDGRFTASGFISVEAPIPEPRPEPEPDPNAKQKDGQEENKTIDTKIYEPLFESAAKSTLYADYVKVAGSNKVKLLKANKKRDEEEGIDYEIFIFESGNNFIMMQEKYYRSIDLKTVETSLGDQDFYEHPNITFNLFKTYGQEANQEKVFKGKDKFQNRTQEIMSGEFHPGSYTNGKHLNNTYIYMIPKSLYTKKQLMAMDPKMAIASIPEAKMYTVRKKVLHKYIDSRILKQDNIKNLIGYFTKNRREKTEPLFGNIKKMALDYGYTIEQEKRGSNASARIQIPILGENFKATLHFKRDLNNGVMEVRIYLPTMAFNNPDFKNKVRKNLIKFK